MKICRQALPPRKNLVLIFGLNKLLHDAWKKEALIAVTVQGWAFQDCLMSVSGSAYIITVVLIHKDTHCPQSNNALKLLKKRHKSQAINTTPFYILMWFVSFFSSLDTNWLPLCLAEINSNIYSLTSWEAVSCPTESVPMAAETTVEAQHTHGTRPLMQLCFPVWVQHLKPSWLGT